MTKILILIFTVLLALNIHASDTRYDKETATTGINDVIYGQILIGLTDHYGPPNKSSVIETLVYFKIIERSQDELGLIINYNNYTLELFYDQSQSRGDFTLLHQGRALHVMDDTLKKEFNAIITNIKFNIIRFLPKPYPRMRSLATILTQLNHITKDPNNKQIHLSAKPNSQDNSFADTRTNFSGSNPLYTMICESVGKTRTAHFGYQLPFDMSKDVIVGDPNTHCLGRSGVRCDGERHEIWMPWPFDNIVWWTYDTQYTQESLNHDVCVDELGDALCLNELALAAPGWLYDEQCF